MLTDTYAQRIFFALLVPDYVTCSYVLSSIELVACPEVKTPPNMPIATGARARARTRRQPPHKSARLSITSHIAPHPSSRALRHSLGSRPLAMYHWSPSASVPPPPAPSHGRASVPVPAAPPPCCASPRLRAVAFRPGHPVAPRAPGPSPRAHAGAGRPARAPRRLPLASLLIITALSISLFFRCAQGVMHSRGGAWVCRRWRRDFGESDQSRAAFDVRCPLELNISVLLNINSMRNRWGNKEVCFIWQKY